MIARKLPSINNALAKLILINKDTKYRIHFCLFKVYFIDYISFFYSLIYLFK